MTKISFAVKLLMSHPSSSSENELSSSGDSRGPASRVELEKSRAMMPAETKPRSSELLCEIARALGVSAEIFLQQAPCVAAAEDDPGGRMDPLLTLIGVRLQELGSSERRRFGDSILALINATDTAG